MKRLARIHPAVACSAIWASVCLCGLAQAHSGDPLLPLKFAAMGLIGVVVGIKVRKRMPVT